MELFLFFFFKGNICGGCFGLMVHGNLQNLLESIIGRMNSLLYCSRFGKFDKIPYGHVTVRVSY